MAAIAQFCTPNAVHTVFPSKPAHNRQKCNIDRNLLLFLNRWRYFDVLGRLLLNFTRQTVYMPVSARNQPITLRNTILLKFSVIPQPLGIF
jgi:hypothetical protein